MPGNKPPQPPVPSEGIDLFDDDERTEIAQPGSTQPQTPGPAPDAGGISLDDDDDERTQIEKKPGPPR